MEVNADDYRVWFDPANSIVFLQGFLRLEGMEAYQPIIDLLVGAIETAPKLTLNLEALEFLNSSGISMLSMFVVKVRQRGDAQLTLQGSDTILWQTKSLKNLQRLMPSLSLQFSS
ncbi:MAG: hypothetical protein HC812_14290 [Leptolyngbya sp. RL_3_1]|nr:hypothetical protein [Leptolyngbya sp. RL_3_1]